MLGHEARVESRCFDCLRDLGNRFEGPEFLGLIDAIGGKLDREFQSQRLAHLDLERLN